MSPRNKLKVDLVIPVFNEAGVVAQTHARIRAADQLLYAFTFIYVDDGSSDATADELSALEKSDPRVRVISLSRNFGHQAALTAGLDASRGDVVVSLDADGQHPPEMIGQMLDLCAQGYDIVQAQRAEDAQLGSFKKWTSGLFYRILNIISGTRVLPGAADFRALSRRAVDALKAMPEYHRFLRGMVSWIGFKTAILPYHQEGRHFLVLARAVVRGPEPGRDFAPACVRGNDLRAFLLGHGADIQPRSGLEFPDVCHPHYRRDVDGPARIYWRLRWIYFPGSEAQAGISRQG
jgi:glycosyltransferase involved in cell wall biosynthesis